MLILKTIDGVEVYAQATKDQLAIMRKNGWDLATAAAKPASDVVEDEGEGEVEDEFLEDGADV